MAISKKVGSSVDSFPSSRGPYDGKLFMWFPTGTMPSGGAFYDLSSGVYNGQSLGVWRLIRRVRDFIVNKNETDGTPRMESRKGKSVPLERFYRERMPTCSFIAGEQFNPYDLQVGFGDGNTPINNATTESHEEEFAMSLHATKLYPLPIEFNLNSDTANTITSVAGADLPTGGSIAAGDYYYAITAIYGTAEVVYESTAESAQVAVTAATGSVTVTWTAATEQPDAYRIYRGAESAAVGVYADPALIGEVAGTILTLVDTLADAAKDRGTPALSIVAPVVKSMDGLTTYVDDTDYTFDPREGTIKRITIADGGSITDGQMVQITFSFALEAGVQIPFDEGRFSSYHVPLMFIGQQTGSRGFTGLVRIIMDNADWTKGADSMDAFAELADAGLPFSDMPLDYNEHTGRFGEFGMYDEQLDGFTVLNMQ